MNVDVSDGGCCSGCFPGPTNIELTSNKDMALSCSGLCLFNLIVNR